jgi:hypothetical protein
MRPWDVPKPSCGRAAAQGRFEGEGWRARKDGSRYWAQVSLTPSFNARGELHGYTKVTRDISERKRLDEELRAAIRVRDQFLTIASRFEGLQAAMRCPLTIEAPGPVVGSFDQPAV